MQRDPDYRTEGPRCVRRAELPPFHHVIERGMGHPASADARRYFVLAVADHHKQDHAYFAAITREMDNGGREALLYELLNRDLSSFNVRDVPQTDALADQKAHTRRGVDRLVEMVAHSGMLPAVHAPIPTSRSPPVRRTATGFTPRPDRSCPTSSTILRL